MERFLKDQREIYIDRLPANADEIPSRVLADIASLKRFTDRIDIPEPTDDFQEWVRNYILYDSSTFQGMLSGITVEMSEEAMFLTGTATLLDLGVEADFNMEDEDLLFWLDDRGKRTPELIQDVSDERVIKNLWKVVYDGKYSIDTAAESLRGEFAFSENRARVIARTEIISAGRSGQYFADVQSGIVIGKQWMAAIDDRVRDGHKEADGQIVKIDEPFLVANQHGDYEKLLFPGDTSLGNVSADNVIQCRCWYKRILEGEEDKLKG